MPPFDSSSATPMASATASATSPDAGPPCSVSSSSTANSTAADAAATATSSSSTATASASISPSAVEAEFSRLRVADPKPSQSSSPLESSPSSPSRPSAPPSHQYNHFITASDAQALKVEGNAAYRESHYDLAAERYSSALQSPYVSPSDRAVLLSNRAAVYLKQGRHADVEADTSEALRLDSGYTKARARRRAAREARSDWAAAAEDAALLGAPPNDIAALHRKAEQKKADDTQQAIEGLKGLGNSILSNFGMSVDDFKLQQNSEGSYSVTMNK